MEIRYFQNEEDGDAHILNHRRDGALCGAPMNPIHVFVYAPIRLCRTCLGPGRPVPPHGSGPQ
jgi:hypothetical protein